MEKVAAICYRFVNDSIKYLLVRTHSGRWTFPKGTVETGEESWFAAQREAFEEAGASGAIEHEPLTAYVYSKKTWEEKGHEIKVYAFLLEVEKTQLSEERDRDPAWFSFPAAEAALVEGRPFKYAEELRRALHEANNRIARSLKK